MTRIEEIKRLHRHQMLEFEEFQKQVEKSFEEAFPDLVQYGTAFLKWTGDAVTWVPHSKHLVSAAEQSESEGK